MTPARRLLALLAALTVVLSITPASAAPVVPPAAAAQQAISPPVWVFGDSVPAGTWLAPEEGWVDRVDNSVDGGIWNFAVGGTSVAFGANRIDARVKASLQQYPNQLPKAIILDGGRNDFIQSDNGVGDLRWAVFNLDSWLAANYPSIKFYVMTVTPYRSDAGYAETLSLRRSNYNTWVRAQFGPSGRVIDAGDLLTAGSTYADIRYYRDFIHPDAEGAEIVAHGVGDFLAEKGIS